MKKNSKNDFYNIDINFRKSLGSISPYMCIVDSSVKEVLTSDFSLSLSELTKKHNHPNIHTNHLDKSKLVNLVYLSHIAFINSEADVACDSIRNLEEIDSKLRGESVGDFLRKTIFVLHYTNKKLKKSKYNFDEDFDIDKINEYINYLDFKIIDYYRKLRNNAFHGNKKDKIKLDDFFNEEQLSTIEIEYKFRPKSLDKLDENDVFLLSLAWQSTIKSLCFSYLKILLPKIVKEFNHFTKERKYNAIINRLKREYLFTDKQVTDIMFLVD